MPNILTTSLKNVFNLNQIALSETQIKKFSQYFELLIDWNQKFNLTRIIKPEEVVTKHFLDSLSVMDYLKTGTLLDIGSGAGFPGVPIGIMEPNREIVLLEKLHKKCVFLETLLAELDLKNIRVIHQKARVFRSKKGFDNIVFRAVGSIENLIEESRHLCHPKGQFIFMKAKKPEIQADYLAQLGFQVTQITDLNLQGLNAERCLVFCKRRSGEN